MQDLMEGPPAYLWEGGLFEAPNRGDDVSQPRCGRCGTREDVFQFEMTLAPLGAASPFPKLTVKRRCCRVCYDGMRRLDGVRQI